MYRSPFGGVPAQSEVESTIRGLTQDFCTAFNTGNYDQAAALFAPDGVLMLSHREWAQGAKAVERMLGRYTEAGYQNLRFETTRVDQSGDMAIEMGRYTVSIQTGSATIVDAGKFLRAWRRLGVWRIVGDSWSSSLPVVEQGIGGSKVA